MFWAAGASTRSLSTFDMGSHRLRLQPVTLVAFTNLYVICVMRAFFFKQQKVTRCGIMACTLTSALNAFFSYFWAHVSVCASDC